MMTLQTIFEVFITRAEDLTFTGSVNFLSDAFLSLNSWELYTFQVLISFKLYVVFVHIKSIQGALYFKN